VCSLTESDLTEWWGTFNDPVLNQLIIEAVDSNLDIKKAEARIREARAAVVISRSDFFPQVVTEAAYTRTRASDNARSSSDGSGSSRSPPNLYEAGFDATWEIDIFGGTRRGVEAAQENFQAEVESRRDMLISLISEVAQNYILLRGTQREWAIADRNIAAQRETLDLQKLRFEAGLANDLTVAQAEAQLRTTSAQLPPLETTISQAIFRLGILLGQPPGYLLNQLTAPAPMPVGPSIVHPGVPADLLRRRPDIRRAERQLAAATANIGVAMADFFPKLDLFGTVSYRSKESGNIFGNDSLYWTTGPNISWNIINWYAVLANVQIQNARQEEALLTYKQTVLQALADVENALTAYRQEQSRRDDLIEGARANHRALDLANQLNQAGVVDFLNVLIAQRAVFESEDQLVQSERAVSGNLVALYKALGGGMDTI